MKKHTIFLGALLLSGFAFSQVGVNTDTPKSTLDVVGKATDTSSLDGITAPRLTGDQLRAKTYTTEQTGTFVYVTVADTAPAGQTVNVTAVGYFYFDGAVWQKVSNGVAATEPWYNQATSTQATANTQNIYQTGKVSIGKNASNGLLSVYDPAATVNMVPFYLGYVSQADNTKNPFIQAVGNVGTGSYSTLSIAGYQALVFSVDGDPTTYTRNSLELIPHVNGGGSAPFGFKITEQGMFSFNAQYPTETLDLANGTMRIRNLPVNGATNAIYTTPSGTASIPASTDITGLAKTQAFTATKTVVADDNGVLGYVTGLPQTPVNIYNADGSLTGNRTLTLNNKSLFFNGSDRSSFWDPAGRIHQRATNTAIDAAMGLHNGNANLWLQQWNSYSAITASDGSTSLSLATHYTNVSAPITLSTSPGNNTTSVERMRITGEGNVGVMTTDPTERFDNAGITRLRNLPTNGATNAINTTSTGDMSAAQDQTFTATRTVVADDNGVLGTVVGLPAVPVNIYNADGTLTSNRTLTQAGYTLTFSNGTGQSTTFNNTNGSGIEQRPGSAGRANLRFYDSSNALSLSLYTDNNNDSQMYSQGSSTSLILGTHLSAVPAPLRFVTSAGSNAAGTEKMRITPTGNVGINTSTPTELLDNNGITRLRNLPTNGAANAIYTQSNGAASATQNQTFTATRTVVADNNGVAGSLPFLPVPVVITGGDGVDAVTSTQTLKQKNSNGSNGVSATFLTKTFTLTQKSLVTISYNLSANNINTYNGTILSDGASKKIEAYVNVDGSSISASSLPFTNSTSAYNANGIYSFGASRSILLNPGSHTIVLRAQVFVSQFDNVGVSVDFGSGGLDQFDIIAIPTL